MMSGFGVCPTCDGYGITNFNDQTRPQLVCSRCGGSGVWFPAEVIEAARQAFPAFTSAAIAIAAMDEMGWRMINGKPINGPDLHAFIDAITTSKNIEAALVAAKQAHDRREE